MLGAATCIGPGCEIGAEGPVTLDDCQLADDVTLAGGFFTGSVFLSGVSFGSCGHVRPGSILEEQVSCAHAVGLKQTVLMPHVVLGSLVNFCDCLMAGGTDSRNHSEVGSSFVHFNYTPHRDKATASMLGDVPRGVMLDQPPIFLGGQGGLVGPVRIEFGTVIAAGTVCRRNVGEPGHMVSGGSLAAWKRRGYEPGVYGDISRTLVNNLSYIGNLHAFFHWYDHVRRHFMSGKPHLAACHEGALSRIRLLIHERGLRLTELAGNLIHSLRIAREKFDADLSAPPFVLQEEFVARWPEISKKMQPETTGESGQTHRGKFLDSIEKPSECASYLTTIKALSATQKRQGTRWLQVVADDVADQLKPLGIGKGAVGPATDRSRGAEE